jgi:hypothetical protein
MGCREFKEIIFAASASSSFRKTSEEVQREMENNDYNLIQIDLGN